MSDSSYLESGLDFFNAGEYYLAHETWEDLWRQTQGPRRQFYQGLIQAAVGLYHLGNGNLTGAHKQIRKAIRNLRESSDPEPALDSAGLIAQLESILENAGSGTVRIARLK